MSIETPNQAVNPAESAPVEQTVNEQSVETTTEEQTVASQTNEQSQEVSTDAVPTEKINAELYDERGVSYKNVAMEYKRKFEENQTALPKLIAEEVAKLTQQKTEKKYSIGELEQFAQANPEHRAWVEQEKARIQKEEILSEFNQRMEATTKQQKDEMVRGQVFNTVLAQFPDIAIRDQRGNFQGWNNLNPMTQIMGRYMSDPALSSRPDGLAVAAKLAYADTMLSKMPQTQKKVASLQSQLKKVQAQTFVEGGGRKVTESSSPNKKHLERVAQTGRAEDAAGVFRNIHSQMGLTKE